MVSRSIRSIVVAALLLTAAPGCGSGAEGSDGDAAAELPDGPLLPFQRGNTWTYRVTDDGEVTTKVVTIGEETTVGGDGPNKGKKAFKVVTKKGATDQTISWQAVEHDLVVRYREQSFSAKTGALELEEHWDPYKLHVDGSAEHTQEGASWLEVYQETKKPVDGSPTTSTERDRWIVDAIGETVTVPAGTFTAIILQKAGGDNLKTYWYVPGVGKVKETGGQTEELLSYEVAP